MLHEVRSDVPSVSVQTGCGRTYTTHEDNPPDLVYGVAAATRGEAQFPVAQFIVSYHGVFVRHMFSPIGANAFFVVITWTLL